jgi:hypothetical protein
MPRNVKILREGSDGLTVSELLRLLVNVHPQALVMVDPVGNGEAFALTTVMVATVERRGKSEHARYRVQEQGERGIPAVLLD